MIGTARRLALCVVACVALAGCSAGSLSQLQSSFEDLVRNHKACTDDVDLTKNLSCMRDFRNAMFVLSQDADKLVGRFSDERTVIAAKRLAGLAAWQAGQAGYASAERHADEGTRRCTTLQADRNRYGAPRDCALLLVLRGMVAQARTVDAIRTLDEEWQALSFAQRVERLKPLVASHIADSWNWIDGRLKTIKGYRGIDKATLAFLDDEKRAMYCTYHAVRKRLDGLAPADGGQRSEVRELVARANREISDVRRRGSYPEDLSQVCTR